MIGGRDWSVSTLFFFRNMEKKYRLFSIIWNCFIFMNRRFHSQKRQWLFLLATMLIVTCIFLRETYKYPDFRTTNKLVESRLSEILIRDKGSGCEMPSLNPFSKEAMQFYKIVPNITCSGIDWVTCHKAECYVTQQILDGMKNIECTYRDIIFMRDDYYYIGEPTKVFGREKYVLTKSDHVKVSCLGMDVNGFGIIPTHWSGNRAGFRPVQFSLENSLNILIVIFDSTSRNGFIRRMPQSYKVLKKELQAVVLNSYNIVGDGTPGALFPILTGHMELELQDSRKTFSNNQYVDLKPFLFQVLKKHGYITAYFEEMPWIGTFQNRFNGFEHQPTDHYLRPFFMEEYNGRWWNGRQKYCVGAEPQHRFLMNLTKQFFELAGTKFCLSFIAEISHEDFNMISAADEDLASFLKTFKDDKRLEDTMLIVMGDHGARFSSIRNTYQGKIEERLPFVSIVLPKKLKKGRPDALKNLKTNENVLTTHYDMHTTLLDALGLKKYRNSYKVPGSDLDRGLSILEQIPKSRSCAEAGIMPHWCACAKWYNVSHTDDVYNKAAAALSGYIDSISEEKRLKCASRTLLRVEWVLRQSPSDGMLGYKNRKEVDRYIGKFDDTKRVRAANEYYQVKIVMGPGRSVFEGSLQYIVEDDFFVISERDISRINAYGDEPKCVSATHPHLNKYCYCKDRLNSEHYPNGIYP